MKLADMISAYAEATGEKIMHRVGVAEMLLLLVQTSRDSRAEAIEQFRTSLIGYVNESIDLMKSADIDDKDALLTAIRGLIAEMQADRMDILAGEPPVLPGIRPTDAEAKISGTLADNGDRKNLDKLAKNLKDLASESDNKFVKGAA